MGYGMFAFSSLGENYFADGALAGLATAAIVPVVSVLLGDKTTTVYAPRVTSTFFIGLLIFGLVRSKPSAMATGGIPFTLAIAFLVLLLGGVLEALFGLIKLGTLIKFAPQPVMAGFQNAAAALLFLVQLGNVCGFDHTIPFTQVHAPSRRDQAAQPYHRGGYVRDDVESTTPTAENSADYRRHRRRLDSRIFSAISSALAPISARSSPA